MSATEKTRVAKWACTCETVDASRCLGDCLGQRGAGRALCADAARSKVRQEAKTDAQSVLLLGARPPSALPDVALHRTQPTAASMVMQEAHDPAVLLVAFGSCWRQEMRLGKQVFASIPGRVCILAASCCPPRDQRWKSPLVSLSRPITESRQAKLLVCHGSSVVVDDDSTQPADVRPTSRAKITIQ